jgi:hypothetical protein
VEPSNLEDQSFNGGTVLNCSYEFLGCDALYFRLYVLYERGSRGQSYMWTSGDYWP